ncbi:hypothetical protein GCM10028810_52390 [Spirosoma litoris]
MKKAAGYVATASLVACSFVTSVTVAMPSQVAFTTPSTTGKESVKETPVLARNTTAKPETPATTTATVKEQDKKTIGRCWKRLMTMVREVSHAHKAKQ